MQQQQHQQPQYQQPPPPQPQPQPQPQMQSQQQQQQQQQQQKHEQSQHPPSRNTAHTPSQQLPLLHQPVPMDISAENAPQTTSAKLAKKDKGATTAPPSNAPSPKPSRAIKEPPPPLPQGSGLISGALFGVDDSSTTSKSAPNIILHIPLHGANNKVVNFARMAEEKYGFAALHPRLAAQRERLARVAAASAALEKSENGTKGVSAGDSAEENLSVDIDRESDGDGDVSMSGTGLATGANSAGNDVAPTADGKKKRARKKKIEEYDREDPFVDDSEMAWQEHAAASKDGFFVYSGPLVPDGDKVQVERFALSLLAHIPPPLFFSILLSPV
jgi:HPC2/ubinuclein domain-containing protein